MQFVSNYTDFFKVATKDSSGKARAYLAGLLKKAPRKNMERMEDYVEAYDYEAQQQFLSNSPWCHKALMKRIALDANKILSGSKVGLLIDESAFEKKGNRSAGVARQWNGRLGKIDNCQVGVFAALSDGAASTLIDGALYLPEHWIEDNDRCELARIPVSERRYRSKCELALEMIERAVEAKLDFGWVGFDAFYGGTPWLLRKVGSMGLRFVADVRSNQSVYEEDPRPYLPRRKEQKGPKFTNRRTRSTSVSIEESLLEDAEINWEEIEIRDGTKGKVRVLAARKRVWLWDGKERCAHQWWALATIDPATAEKKFILSNAPQEASLEEIVRQHAVRFWIERSFQDAKTSLGMADYQARVWTAWHHHMGMVMMAQLFSLLEKRVHMREVEMLSVQDIVELLNVYLPRPEIEIKHVIANIQRRHDKRRESIRSAIKNEEKRKRGDLIAL